MAGFIDRIRGTTRGSGQANGPENAPSNPGTLVIGKLIGAGGEGAVYEDRNDPHMVIKVLHQQHATPERSAKLQAMCNNPPQNAQALSWPDAWWKLTPEASVTGCPELPGRLARPTGSSAPMREGSCPSASRSMNTGRGSGSRSQRPSAGCTPSMCASGTSIPPTYS